MRMAFWLFIAAGVSDGIDGFIAKRFQLRSELGALLDPIADKALLMGVYATLGVTGGLPIWLVILVVARDIMILGGFLLSGVIGEAPSVRPLFISKVNTVLQIALIGLVLGRQGYAGLDLDGIFEIGIWAVGVSTFLSGAAYLVRWAREFGHRETPS